MSGKDSSPNPRSLSGIETKNFRSFASFSGKGSRAVEAWFLGPRAENAEVLERLVLAAVRDQVYWRRNFHPDDPIHITASIKRSPEYLDALDRLEEGYLGLLGFLKKSVPFFSMRYQGHMNWETTLPAILGYFATTLYNPNNVAFEGSTATTILEQLVGDDLCRMLGYKVPTLDKDTKENALPPWGHITCGGTVANIEAIWSSRNLKYYPIALRSALLKDVRLTQAREIVRVTPAGYSEPKPLCFLEDWPALNIAVDEILGLPAQVSSALGLNELDGAKLVSDAVAPYSLQNLGYEEFTKQMSAATKSAVLFVPGTKHYSFPKAAALLGIGSTNLYDIKVDANARLDIEDLRTKLAKCATEKRPVLMTVAVMGSTEESSVDPLSDVLLLRDELMSHGICFVVHADAAFGGYHASIERPDFDMPAPGMAWSGVVSPQWSGLSDYCKRQYAALGMADSITVDPHKSGYIPYPAGALCYRNSRMRNLVTFSAPVVYHGEAEPTVGIYGIEGSKPGAAVAAVYLSHRVIRPSRSGYGAILGRALYSCKRLYARLLETRSNELFYAVPVPQLPNSIPGKDEQEKVAFVIANVSRPNSRPPADIDAHLRAIGPDLNILAYAFNFKYPSGKINRDLHLANSFNEAIYRELSLKPFEEIHGKDMIVSTTNIDRKTYGDLFFDSYTARLGTTDIRDANHITVLRSVVMDPWFTENNEDLGATSASSHAGKDFLDEVELALKRAATAAYHAVSKLTTE